MDAKAPEGWGAKPSNKNKKLITYAGIGAAVLLVVACVIAIPVAVTQSKNKSNKHASVTAPALVPAKSHLDTCTWGDFYLPTGVVTPSSQDIHVNLTLQPPYHVQGHTRINVNILDSNRCVVLHAADMNITAVSATFNNSEHKGTVKLNTDNQTLTLVFDEALPEGPVSLDMSFAYIMVEGLSGFYRTSYQENGTIKEMAVTMLETTHARRAFPCFDEPTFKANFTVAVTAPANLTVLNNMPLLNKTKNVDGSLTWQFDSTPPMSSYLVAWAVGQFASQKNMCRTMAGETEVGVWSTPPRANQLKTAVEIACTSMQAFEELLGVPFPLPKLDLLGVPDFGPGAMENWGLLMYKEKALLVNPEADSLLSECAVAVTIAHELVHHWFGDLVTLKDWTQLWLNEGFAAYLQSVGADAYNANFSSVDRIYVLASVVAMNDDSQPSAHPLVAGKRMEHVNDGDLFADSIMYSKGAVVLRMLRVWMNRDSLDKVPTRSLMEAAEIMRESMRRSLPGGRRQLAAEGPMATKQLDLFMKGLHHYLEKYKYNNTGYADLWSAIGEGASMPDAPELDVAGWMNTWTLRNGYPLLTLQSNPDNTATLTQSPFSSGTNSSACDDKQPLGSWWVPLSFIVEGDEQLHWTSFNSCSVTIPLKPVPNSPAPYVLLNAGRFGYYRVNYPEAMWTQLTEAAADSSKISEVDLAGLLEDSFRLAEQGKLNITVFLELSRNLGVRIKGAPEYSTWYIAGAAFQKMSRLLGSDIDNKQCSLDMATYITTNITGPVTKGYQPEGATKPTGLDFNVLPGELVQLRLMRQEVLRMAGAYGDNGIGATALKLLQSTQNGAGKVHGDIQEQAYYLAVASDNPTAWELVRSMYTKAVDADEKGRLLKALTAANSPAIITKSLNLMLDKENGPRTEDLNQYAIDVGSHSGLSFNMTWEFLFKNFDVMVERLGDSAGLALGNGITYLAGQFADNSQWARLEKFAKQWQAVLPPSFLETTSASIKQNGAWVKANGRQACEWFAKNAA